jgi:hypothetical protein
MDVYSCLEDFPAVEQRRPISEFLILLDLAEIWAARGQIREALAGIEAARPPEAAAQRLGFEQHFALNPAGTRGPRAGAGDLKCGAVQNRRCRLPSSATTPSSPARPSRDLGRPRQISARR